MNVNISNLSACAGGRQASSTVATVLMIAWAAAFVFFYLLVATASRGLAQDKGLPDIVAPAPAKPAQATPPAAPGAAAGSPAGIPTTTPTAVGVVFVDTIEESAMKTAAQGLLRVRARVADAIGTPEDARRLEGVLLRGNLDVDATGAGAVKWTSVMRGDTGAVQVLATPLESRFRFAGAAEIHNGQAVTAAGDTGSLLNAARALYGQGAAPPAADPAAAPAAAGPLVNAVDPAALQRGITGTQASPVAASGAGLGEQSKIKTPDVITAEKDAAPPVTGTTTEGCAPRVDLAANVVIVQSRLTENGVPTGACTDTNTTFGIRVTDSGCTDLIETSSGLARPQTRRYYVDGGGTTQFVDADCQPDSSVAFPLAEDASQCTPLVDMNAMSATVRSRLVYVNGKGETKTVQDCRPTPGKAAVALTVDAAACGLRHDFVGGASYEQAEASYVLDGKKIVAQACSDTGVTFAHQRIANACDPVVDLNANLATPQYRVRIDRAGTAQYITDCTPDTQAGVALVKTKEGCESNFQHNVTAGQSFGTARYYHELLGPRTYVTSCVMDAAAAYAHQTEITGYQSNDQTKISQPTTRIHFMAPTVGDVEVSGPMVRPGAAEIPYTLRTTETRPSGNVTYVGCDAYTDLDTWKVYDRVDGTAYEEKTGPAAPGTPRAACHPVISWVFHEPQQVETSTSTVCLWDMNEEGGPRAIGYLAYRSGKYDGTNKVTREDGIIVSTLTGQKDLSPCSNTVCGGPGLCPATPPVSNQLIWNGELGWT